MSDTITRNQLVEKIVKENDFTKNQSKEIISAFFEQVVEELEKGNKVRLDGIGTLDVSHRKERKGRNPSNGKEITIAASNVVRFKSSQGLKTALNK